MLAKVVGQLEADGCVLELSDAKCKVTSPDQLIAGDFVRVRLWLESEGACIEIPLAEVTKIHNHWMTVDVIQLNAQDRKRLERFVGSRAAMYREQPAQLNRILVRA